MISILLPSRGRPDEAKVCLDSFGVEKNDNLEVLFWLDSDDSKLDQYKEIFSSYPHVKIFIKERVRYKNVHVMANFLAEQAVGEWLMFMVDDTYMPNPDWYEVVMDFTKSLEPLKKPIVINIWGQGVDIANFYPIMSRKYLGLLGHLSASTAIDDWIRVVALESGINLDLLGIKPDHLFIKEGIEGRGLVDKTSADVEQDRIEAKKAGIRWNVRRCKDRGQLWRDIDKIKDFNSVIIK
jgi:hypothetical protein